MTGRTTVLSGLPRISVKLVGEDGNAYAIMGRVSKAARKAGWTAEQVEILMTEMRSGDYNNLLATAMEYCDDTGDAEWDETSEDWG